MSTNDDLGDRMKQYEQTYTNVKMLPRVPIIIRLDGVSFSKWTKPYKKAQGKEDPFNNELREAFVETCKIVGDKMHGAKLFYMQSDEITILLTDESKNDHVLNAWFGWKLQKIVSIAASMFTAHFNEILKPTKPAYFDARAFSLPNMDEVNNCFLWRERDCVKNSVSMLAHSMFSHKSLHGLKDGQMQEKLFTEGGINWNNITSWKKRGTVIGRVASERSVVYKRDGVEHNTMALRSKWEEIEFNSFGKTSVSEIIQSNKG